MLDHGRGTDGVLATYQTTTPPGLERVAQLVADVFEMH